MNPEVLPPRLRVTVRLALTMVVGFGVGLALPIPWQHDEEPIARLTTPEERADRLEPEPCVRITDECMYRQGGSVRIVGHQIVIDPPLNAGAP